MIVAGAKIPIPLGFIPPCLPTPSRNPPRGSAWVHEIKHDGYRLIARRDGKRVRLYTRRGYNWSGKYPWILGSLLSLRVRSITVDGEAVWAGKHGKSEFDKLHSGAHNDEVFLYAFDLLELNSEDYQQHSLEKRKGKLEKLLARTQGMRFSEHLDGDGETIFKHACKMGLEGIVSKRRDFPYRSGRCKSWVKLKNPGSAAVLRIQDGSW
jgi:bifunctional non-homologous end joining protein LigD